MGTISLSNLGRVKPQAVVKLNELLWAKRGGRGAVKTTNLPTFQLEDYFTVVTNLSSKQSQINLVLS